MSEFSAADARHICSAPLAYSVAGASAATGIGRTLITEALRTGRLSRHYLNTKVVILASDLLAWLEGLPTRPPEKGA